MPGATLARVWDETHRTCLDALAEAHGIALSAEVRASLAGFAALTEQWSRRTDLTSATSPQALAEVTFLDAFAMIAAARLPEGAHMVDVGAGAGAPTIPYCLMEPCARAVLIEPRRKRVAFLRVALGTLGLQGRVSVEEAKLDPNQATGDYDVALSRATFPPETWLPLGFALAPTVVVFGGAEPLPADVEGASVAAHHNYSVPSTGARRSLCVYERRSSRV